MLLHLHSTVIQLATQIILFQTIAEYAKNVYQIPIPRMFYNSFTCRISRNEIYRKGAFFYWNTVLLHMVNTWKAVNASTRHNTRAQQANTKYMSTVYILPQSYISYLVKCYKRSSIWPAGCNQLQFPLLLDSMRSTEYTWSYLCFTHSLTRLFPKVHLCSLTWKSENHPQVIHAATVPVRRLFPFPQVWNLVPWKRKS